MRICAWTRRYALDVMYRMHFIAYFISHLTLALAFGAFASNENPIASLTASLCMAFHAELQIRKRMNVFGNNAIAMQTRISSNSCTNNSGCFAVSMQFSHDGNDALLFVSAAMLTHIP